MPLLTGKVDAVHPAEEVIGWELNGHRSVRQGEWKIVWDQAVPTDQRRWQMFNIDQDPFEQNDLSITMPEKFAEMLKHWDEYAVASGVIY